MDVMPKWAEVILVPLISLILAAILSALVILAIGEDPWAAVKLMVDGALGSTYGWGYTLYYATNFMFTGLAVAIAFHARLFNIGGEGQAALGGLGVALVCLPLNVPCVRIKLRLPCSKTIVFQPTSVFLRRCSVSPAQSSSLALHYSRQGTPRLRKGNYLLRAKIRSNMFEITTSALACGQGNALHSSTYHSRKV